MSLFHISNLSCQYTFNKTVLEISDLTIPSGELIFVVGLSGVGKSTFIETLGLMNETIAPNSNTRILFTPDNGNSYELSDIWTKPSVAIADLRQKYFSFVFQQTNLMPNFSVYENMAIGMMIQKMKTEEIRHKIDDIMRVLHLDEDILHQKVFELSGGQKQRVAFIRAVTSDFEVLFGDEPTGNLDPKTAIKLMAYLKEMLADKQKTGLIVSHDIQLALNFAHRIIVIEPVYLFPDNKKKYFGRIISDNQITVDYSNKWKDNQGQLVNDPRKWIHDRLGEIES